MSELEQIAASVAKALGVEEPEYCADVFDPEWQARCRDWLLENGYTVWFRNGNHGTASIGQKPAHGVDFPCPAAEFCARAIHQLMTKK